MRKLFIGAVLVGVFATIALAAGRNWPGSEYVAVTLDTTAISSDSGYISIAGDVSAYRTAVIHFGVRGPYGDTLGMAAADTVYLITYSEINNVLYKVDSAVKFAIPGTYYKPIVSTVGDTLLKRTLITKYIIHDTSSLALGDTTAAGELKSVLRNYQIYWDIVTKE